MSQEDEVLKNKQFSNLTSANIPSRKYHCDRSWQHFSFQFLAHMSHFPIKPEIKHQFVRFNGTLLEKQANKRSLETLTMEINCNILIVNVKLTSP